MIGWRATPRPVTHFAGSQRTGKTWENCSPKSQPNKVYADALSWKKRKQVPDIHIDYRVEVVDNGEPTGLHFQAQVKGRSIHKRRSKNLSEPIKTKHLRYYLLCEEPVFLFLIDPCTKLGSWVFVQGYLKERVPPAALRRQKHLSITFDPKQSFESLSLFDKDVRAAWQFMRDLHPGSPIAAIIAEKERLERLDARYSVNILATADFKQVLMEPREPMNMQVKFLNAPGSNIIKNFYEKGESFEVKASEIVTEDSPILTAILRELGDAKIRITDGRSFKGCLQVSFGDGPNRTIIQVDGEWVLALRRLAFRGQLAESPLKAELTREKKEPGGPGRAVIVFKLDWDAWARQPLFSLAYFSQIQRLIQSEKFHMHSFVRGNELCRAECFTVEPAAAEKARMALEWLERCRRAGQRLGVNPPFPVQNHSSEIESDDVRLLVKLIEEGKHEQANEGLTSELEADIPAQVHHKVKMAARMEYTEPLRLFDFFGVKVPFGPLKHTWTQVALVKSDALKYPRFRMTWLGQPNSTYRIDYEGALHSAARGAGGP